MPTICLEQQVNMHNFSGVVWLASPAAIVLNGCLALIACTTQAYCMEYT